MDTQIITANEPVNGDPRRDNFLRIANRRLPEALERIRLLKNLFIQPYRYMYTNEELDLICRKLQYALDDIKRHRRPVGY